MPFEDLLGTIAPLSVLRFGPPGAFLVPRAPPRGGDARAATILLPASEVPGDCKEGDLLDAFVYLDSEDRPIATLAEPTITRGEVTFLEVTDLAPFGAFVDWGLLKELLVPHREQTTPMNKGVRYPVGLYLDDTGRLAGTMRVAEMLKGASELALDEWVDGEALRDEPGVGLFVIVEKRTLGLVPATEPHGLSRGDAARFRVSHVLPDGKIELSLRGLAHEELERDAERVLDAMTRAVGAGAPLRIGDRSSPDEIRATFGLSKKAFKRAVGRLMKNGALALDAAGLLRLRR